MSSIWTPGGERPVNRQQAGGNPRGGQGPPQRQQPQNQPQERAPSGFEDPGQQQGADGPSAEQLAELQRQLAETPADVVVANHCFGLFELAALHMSLDPPKLSEAQLAIDALAAVVENLTGRLGEAEPHLTEGLNQLRLAFVQVRQRTER